KTFSLVPSPANGRADAGTARGQRGCLAATRPAGSWSAPVAFSRGLVAAGTFLLDLPIPTRTVPDAASIPCRICQAPRGHRGADADGFWLRGAVAREPLRRVPLRSASAGRLLRSWRRPKARCARQPADALHARP